MSTETEARHGRLERRGDRYAVFFERRMRHSPERIWAAITDPADLEKWFPAWIEVEGEWRAGAKLSYPFPNGEGPTENGVVKEFEPPRLLAVTWGEQELRYEIEPDGDGSRLAFTHLIDKEETAKTAAGWELCFEELDALLDGIETGAEPSAGEFDRERWKRLHEGYAREFGVGLEALDEYRPE